MHHTLAHERIATKYHVTIVPIYLRTDDVCTSNPLPPPNGLKVV